MPSYPTTQQFQAKSVPAIHNMDKPSYLIPGISALLAGGAMSPELVEMGRETKESAKRYREAQRLASKARAEYKAGRQATSGVRKSLMNALKRKGWLFALPLLTGAWVASKRGKADKQVQERNQQKQLDMLRQMMNRGVPNGR